MKEEANKFQDTTSGSGYFKEYFQNFKNTLEPSQIEEFSKIKTDDGRVDFVYTLLPECKDVSDEPNCGKNAAVAQQMKDKGNAEFVRGDTRKALASYTKAMLKTPHVADSSSDLAVAIANRSAALYHLDRFEEAIQDVDVALSLGYPKELRYKALERKAKSLLALKRHAEGLDTFKKTLQALDDCKLQTDKKMKMQNNIQIMLNVLNKPTTKQGHINAFVAGKKESKTETLEPSFPEKRNMRYPAISEKVAILEGEDVGRYASAAKDIDPGEVVAIEQSYCSVLLAEHTATHCVHCLKRTETPYPCAGCSIAVFCSSSCRETAQSTYHRYECSITHALYGSGASVMVIMAIRMITQKRLQYFWDLKTSLQEDRDGLKTYKSDDYMAVYHLVRHEHQRKSDDFLERTAMAVFLLRCLQRVGYFGEKEAKPALRPLKAEELFIGGLILRHLQLLQFNAHEIAELETDCTESIEKGVSIFLGGGIFPTLALFNHSCNPAVVRYFIGKTVIVRTVRGVLEGEPVAENYGPIFTTKPRVDRHRSLSSQYWFECGCRACVEDWPLLTGMDRKVIRFRCESGGNVRCSGVIQVPFNTEEFMPKCGACGKHTNILKGLKVLQDTDSMFRQAALDTDRGKFQAALDIYLEILRLLDKHLAPPYYDYHLCQQAVRKCMLNLGSKYARET